MHKKEKKEEPNQSPFKVMNECLQRLQYANNESTAYWLIFNIFAIEH